ncbi:MAG: molybdenum cofactor biosynthesis F family protein [Actinobacteria bacterium]|nr:molybdenum cofactor biosynthesis F family protein [Actinomycetota bacterium]
MLDQPAWIPVGELSDAFHPGSHAPTPTAELASKTILLHLDDGRTAECAFLTASRLLWKLAAGAQPQGAEPSENRPGESSEGHATYWAARLREGIYFVDFIWAEQRATTISLLLDLGRGIATVLIGQLPEEAQSHRCLLDRISAGDELTAVAATFISASIDRPLTQQTPRHTLTQDLVGRRVEYTYSPDERYEHIYLNDSFYTWHCLQGSEKGLADTDRCHYLKVDDELYVFVWREKIVPTLGVVAVDFAAMRTAGKIFGYKGTTSGDLANFPVGAHARLLNVTTQASS